MAAGYSQNSPIFLPVSWIGASMAGASATKNIPIPPGWVASIRMVVVSITTTLAASTAPWGLVQVGDGTTANKYAQLQLGESTHIPTAGQFYYCVSAPPAAGVNVAGVAGGTDYGLSQTGLTGRNPANAASAGVSGPFLFQSGPSGAYPSTTGQLVITLLNQGGTPSAGVVDIFMIIELSDVG